MAFERDRAKKLVLIDAMAILHRAFHAYPTTLSTDEGEVINAVYGFTSILLAVLEKLRPTHVIVAWDVGEPTLRHKEYVEYKATREKPDELLLGQIERTKEVVTVLNIPQFGIAGYEADDLIGTLAKLARGAEVVIVTGDRDALQLIEGERVIVYMPPSSARGYGRAKPADRGPMIYDQTAFEAKYGLKPEQVIDLKGLMGDSSDNIPGVKGVGLKTATELLQKFGTVEKLYKKLDAVNKPRVKQLLEDGRERAFLSKQLATIKTDAPVKLDWEKCRLADYDREEAVELFQKLGFKSLYGKLPKDSWEESLTEIFS